MQDRTPEPRNPLHPQQYYDQFVDSEVTKIVAKTGITATMVATLLFPLEIIQTRWVMLSAAAPIRLASLFVMSTYKALFHGVRQGMNAQGYKTSLKQATAKNVLFTNTHKVSEAVEYGVDSVTAKFGVDEMEKVLDEEMGNVQEAELTAVVARVGVKSSKLISSIVAPVIVGLLDTNPFLQYLANRRVLASFGLQPELNTFTEKYKFSTVGYTIRLSRSITTVMLYIACSSYIYDLVDKQLLPEKENGKLTTAAATILCGSFSGMLTTFMTNIYYRQIHGYLLTNNINLNEIALRKKEMRTIALHKTTYPGIVETALCLYQEGLRASLRGSLMGVVTTITAYAAIQGADRLTEELFKLLKRNKQYSLGSCDLDLRFFKPAVNSDDSQSRQRIDNHECATPGLKV